ncbi:MAG: ABC transporter ATP-binding protein [Anaerolineae bacterium]|nr:ABC transporter ATP-binding protein [Anaerolineae bacterium]MDW8098305.1 ABC transporter ATP-binding protein [Anaerolineae bacterium]
MARVTVQNVVKRFKTVTALRGISFEINDGEFFVLLGPTGAGKTTTLRVIAGLERQDEGHVLFDGQPVDHLTPSERDVAFVFEQYSLYPTMTVYENLAFPLRSPLRRMSEPDIRRRVTAVAEKLRISHLLDRTTAHLSGGEMQRVSLGRALVREPRIFLMDEPLSNLDAKLREALRIELKHLQKTEGNTTLFVTHDQIEALTMSDRIAVLNKGCIVQIGTPEDIYDRPATTFVAQLVGTPRINLFEARREDDTLWVVNSTLRLPAPAGSELPPIFLLGVRPEDVQVCHDGEFSGEIALIEPLGVETILHIKAGKQTLLSIAPGMTPLRVGDPVRFSILRERLHYFRSDGMRIAA